jgi:hypothetical protein
LPGRTAVNYLAWVHSANELVQPDTDRATTARRMKSLLAAEPDLNTAANRALLVSLEATLIPSKAKPGSIEQLIDELSEMCNCSSRARTDWEPDPRYTRLAQMGFAAVPGLIDHLDDKRLTRSIQGGAMNCPPSNMPIQVVVSDVLKELAGAEVAMNWREQLQGRTVEKADVLAWWDEARKVGEKAYFLKHVLPEDKNADWLNSFMLDMIARKYPDHLPRLYRTILDERPRIGSWGVAEAVAKSSLPVERKRDLFLHAAKNTNLEHRRAGLFHLQEVDAEQFITILLATLEALPKTPKEPYCGCREAAYAVLVLRTDDPRAWKMLFKVAKRSDVGLRMEFLNWMTSRKWEGRQRQLRLDFLAPFLDDAEAPDLEANPKMFDGPHAGFAFPRLTVRDLAAMQIAYILRMPDRPDWDWTPKQWEKLRTRVKQALQH